MGKDYRCNACKYAWTSKKTIGEPFKCPKCISRDIKLDHTKIKRHELTEKYSSEDAQFFIDKPNL